MLGERIRTLRRDAKLTQEDLARKVGTTKQNIYKYEKGIITNLPIDRLEALASALDTSPAQLMGWDDPDDSPYAGLANVMPMPKTRYVPILGTVACGLPILAEENLDGYAAVPEDVHADFCLRCAGDSMIGARIFDGDMVYIKKTSECRDGDICAVLIEGDATLKRVYRIGASMLELRAENPTFPILRYSGDQLADVSIMGIAVAFTSLVQH